MATCKTRPYCLVELKGLLELLPSRILEAWMWTVCPPSSKAGPGHSALRRRRWKTCERPSCLDIERGHEVGSLPRGRYSDMGGSDSTDPVCLLFVGSSTPALVPNLLSRSLLFLGCSFIAPWLQVGLSSHSLRPAP